MVLMQNLLIAIAFGLFLGFVVLNWLSGCTDWSQINCVGPFEYLELFGVKLR